jgi:hypothetical protein
MRCWLGTSSQPGSGASGEAPGDAFFDHLRGTAFAYGRGMHGSFLQRVFTTMLAALFASGLVEAWKFTIKANDEINAPQNWQHATSATPRP